MKQETRKATAVKNGAATKTRTVSHNGSKNGRAGSSAPGNGRNGTSIGRTGNLPSNGAHGSDSYRIERSGLAKLFENSLKDMYWAEKALIKALPKMIKKVTDSGLAEAMENHLAETEGHVQKVGQVFELMGKKPQGKKCEAMEGLIREARDIMEESEKGAMRDAGIISAAQKVEHYEIASYGTLRTFAKTLGMNDAASILEEILEEEKAADEKLTEVAVGTINAQAASKEEEEDDEHDIDDERG